MAGGAPFGSLPCVSARPERPHDPVNLYDQELADVLEGERLRKRRATVVPEKPLRQETVMSHSGSRAIACPVHGAGYGRCLGCLAEAAEAEQKLELWAWWRARFTPDEIRVLADGIAWMDEAA